MKIIITENKLERVAINWLNKNYGDLEQFDSSRQYPDYLFYRKGNKIIFDYNIRSEIVHVNYAEIWSFLESYFGMTYHQIYNLIKVWIEEHYDLDVTTILLPRSNKRFSIEGNITI
jgi:hypothetical protein